jgi:hypothetical protein
MILGGLTSNEIIKKNVEIIQNTSVTLSVVFHLIAPYGFCRHINNIKGKESNFFYLNQFYFMPV